MAQQMQTAMHDKMGQVIGQRFVRRRGLGDNGFTGEREIAEQAQATPVGVGRKSQHIGWLVTVPVAGVKIVYPGVVA